jgi:hypothetical protein
VFEILNPGKNLKKILIVNNPLPSKSNAHCHRGLKIDAQPSGLQIYFCFINFLIIFYELRLNFSPFKSNTHYTYLD